MPHPGYSYDEFKHLKLFSLNLSDIRIINIANMLRVTTPGSRVTSNTSMISKQTIRVKKESLNQ